MKRILGIVGSYRKNGIIDTLVTEALAAAEAGGAATKKIYLIDAHIEFCKNCRQCTQPPGPEPGTCVQTDDMAGILAEWEECDGLVLGAPVNFGNVTAVTRRFMERLLCFAYWPWGKLAPAMRTKQKRKQAVVITSSAMPALLLPLMTGAPSALKWMAGIMGAKVVKTVYVGLAAGEEQPAPPGKAVRKAQAAGRRLASG
ncbi:MAG: flavodoxin family protein [Thermoguttaceae bacterium]|jgi:multimeric flavodoxin WrbA|nr:flavodoxin family protein [Thermoguttaceae bacterium]